MIYVVSVSGGKDSTALWIWAVQRANLPGPVVALFCDTKWECDKDDLSLYRYLDLLESRLGPLRRVTSEGFEERTRRLGTFPSRVRKWCSPELKVQMCAEELVRIREEYQDETMVLVGFRRDESPKRADPVQTPESEWMPDYDCTVWRPLLAWTLADVIREHHIADIPLNPLYLKGAERVGCWPCIHARKSELRLIADLDPERIERVAAIEAAIGQTMFAVEESQAGKTRGVDQRRVIPLAIHDAVEWARTKRGGKEFAPVPAASGCARWAICERGQA